MFVVGNESATLNGHALNTPFLKHTDIINGGELKLVMGERVNKEWGVGR